MIQHAKNQVMSSRIEKAEECVWVSHIATIGHTPLQPFIKKKEKRKKAKFQFLLGLAGMELDFFMSAQREEEERGMFVVTAFVSP